MLQLLLIIVLAALIVVFVSPLVKGSLAVAVGVLGLISALLLKRGRLKRGSAWAGETVLGVVLFSIGLLGFGLDYLFEAFASEFPLASPQGVVLLIMILCLPIGFVVEWRARRARKSPSHSEP